MKRNRPFNQEKRKAIIQAAITEFYGNGFEGSSMDNIAKDANVSKATVYNHFKNKENLFLTIATIIQERLEKSFLYRYSPDIPIKLQLREIARKELIFLGNEENMKLIKIVTIVIIQKNSIGLKLLEIIKDDCMIMTSQWFEDAKSDGKLLFESSSFVSQQFIGMLKSFAFIPQLYGATKLDAQEQNELIDQAIRMVSVLYIKEDRVLT